MKIVLAVGLAFVLLLVVLWASLVAGSYSDDHTPLPTRNHAFGATTSTTSVPLPSAPTPVPSTSMPRSHETAPTAERRSISSTAYCETGHMADGQPAHDGAVSSHVLPRDSRWRVLSGPYAGRVLAVEDTGPMAFFDISMPGRCADARRYGRITIDIEEVR